MSLIAVALLAASACSPDPYPGETGEVLHVGLRSPPRTFDPPLLGDQSSGKIAAPVFEGLLAYHPYARPYQVQPALAAAMPTVSEDGLTHTYTLRSGVTFHDNACFPGGEGRKVVASDVVYAFKRFAHPSVQTRNLWMIREKFAGLTAYRDGIQERIDAVRARGEVAAPLEGLDEVPLSGVTALDDRTVQIRLTEPYPQLSWVLARPTTGIYPRECVEFYGDQWRSNPVGTGPYIPTEYNPVYRAVYKANPDYRDVRVPDPKGDPAQRYPDWEADVAAGHLAHAGKRLPLLDGMEIRFILEDQPRWLYFANGHLDFVNPPKDNVADALPLGELSPTLLSRGVTVQRWTELGTVYACINTEDPVMRNVDLRRAIALAYDHRWTVDNLYSGQALVAKSLIPPGVAGFDPTYHPYHAEDGTAQVERAKEMLAQAGYPGGVDPETGRALHLTFQNSGSSATNRMFATRFVDEMRRIGIEVDVVVNTFPQLTQKMRNGQFSITSLAWGLDYPDAQNILQLLYGPNKAPGAGSARFDDPAFNALYEEAAVLPDSPERTALYERMAHIVSDQVPWITRAHRIRPNLSHKWLHGYKYTEVSNSNLSYVWIDDALRDEQVAEWNRPTRWPAVLVALFFAGLVAVSVFGRKR